MKTRKIILIASLCISVCALVLAWHYKRSAEESASASGTLKREMAEIESRRARMIERLAKADEIQRKAKANGDAPPTAKRGKGGGSSFLDQLASNPDLQNKMLAYQRSGLGLKYGALFMKLGLTSEQIAKCEDNLMARASVDMDLENALRAQDVSPGTPEAAKIRAQLLSGYTTAQRQLLGDAGASQLESYDSDFMWESQVTPFAGASAVSGMALTSDQARQLLAAAMQASHDPASLSGGSVSASYWSNVDSQAAAFLTSAQLNLMKSAEFLGPFGAGSRFQSQLNCVITLGDRADVSAGSTLVSAGPHL
jgi:hypothetical protein